MVSKTFLYQIDHCKKNQLTFSLLVLVAIIVIIIGYSVDKVLHSVAYLFAIWLCSFVVDMYALVRPVTHNVIAIKNPKRELAYVLIFTLLGLAVSLVRFSSAIQWEQLSPMARICIFIGAILFVYPVALAIFLLVKRYKWYDLGLRIKGIIIAPLIIAIIAITAYLIAPENIIWKQIWSQQSFISILFTGFISAALAEEFWRFIAQSRLGAVFTNPGLGWVFATIIWAFMHIPKAFGENKDMLLCIEGAIMIIPLGLLWGYMTYRLRSIIPAVLVHGSNLWGLQNL